MRYRAAQVRAARQSPVSSTAGMSFPNTSRTRLVYAQMLLYGTAAP
jgi:hypothetical protein